MRLFNFLADQPWAITEAYARRMLEIYYAALDRRAKGESLDKSALERELGRPLDNTRSVTIREGVATIPVEGPIFRRADLFSDLSGATTIDVLARDLNAAINDPQVKAIILYVDSPGGEVNGTNEFSDMVFEARGTKPITAYVAHVGASAAYWIASAADEVVIDATASLGSIGVVAAVRDPSKENKREIEFVSSQSPNKRPDPNTEAGKAQIQTVVDDLASVFIDTVARNRGITAEGVIKDFGQGGIFIGQKAVDAGLADRVSSYEQVLSELQGGASGARVPSRSNMRASLSDNGGKTMAEKNWLQRFLSALSGDERREALAALKEGEGAGDAQPPASSSAKPAEESAEMKALREKAERYEAQAKQQREEFAAEFAGSQVIAKTVLPTSKAKLQTFALALANADHALSLTGDASLTAQIKAIFAELPKHQFCTEMSAAELPPGSVALNPDPGSSDPTSVEAARASAKAYGQRANGKSNLQEVK